MTVFSDFSVIQTRHYSLEPADYVLTSPRSMRCRSSALDVRDLKVRASTSQPYFMDFPNSREVENFSDEVNPPR